MRNSTSPQQLDMARAARGASVWPFSAFSGARRLALKVPEVTIFFWIVKLLTTGMGETTSDYLVYRFDPYVVVPVAGVCLVAALLLQFAVRRYIAGVYWLAAVMVAVFGTMVADVPHKVLGIPYAVTTACFAVALAAIFAGWYLSEKTLSIHSVVTTRRELFYWATVMATFALGTAAGDLVAYTLGLGYFAAGLVFTVLFALPWLGYRLFRLNGIFAFWFAYVMTRPLGASFADWMGRLKSEGGLGLGTGPISVILGALIVILVGYLTVTRADVAKDASAQS